MKAVKPVSQSRSRRDRLAAANASRLSVSTVRPVNRSGISCDASHGSAEARLSAAQSGTSHHAGIEGSSARRSRCSVEAASSACTAITGQVVSVRCSDSRNRL